MLIENGMKVLIGIVLLVVAIAGTILVLRAAGPPRHRVARSSYAIVMANRTHLQLDDVGVYYGEQVAAMKGLLVKGGNAGYGIVTLPVPEEATVTWTEESGVHHAPKVKLAGIVPPSPRDMDIWFIIEEDGSVTVKCVPANDHDASVSLLKTLVEVRKRPGTIDDLLVGAKPVDGAEGRFVKPGNVCMADSQFIALVGNLPVMKHPDGSQSATLQDGTAITVHARKPDGGFDPSPKAAGIIRAKLPTGKEIEIRYGGG
jgi:hypothetical protein